MESNRTTADNSMNSLDWEGVYTGILPCADCQGIETMIRLNRDLTFVIQTKYLGKTSDIVTDRGSFYWNKDGSGIVLTGTCPVRPGEYQVGENMIRQLDMEGKQITGALAEKYVLRKSLPEITERYWKLVELMGKKVLPDESNKREPYMILKSENKQVIGSGGCNNFNGSYELKEGNRIAFSKIITTLMACPNLDSETQFLKVLEMADNYFMSADTLVLNRARMAPLARFEAVYLK